TLPMLDMAHVVVVRLGLGIAPWRGDKRHLAHRLAAMTGSKDRLVAPILALLAALAAACLL
ncbi:MAG TPA: undecaprenyl/decaprenyl-phosphate alpha-N-acetylglucosaminyl 1-phosphate transferase, partial [Planctomycetota bacterium]|nr:undecaprenyl/decaprenyl-phosphate alpha-N-acetylglucosaminyl 1-phosphate transferase [Planctomycetota bacterium]